MELNRREELVKKELEYLLIKHAIKEAVSAIDEIVLNYVLGVLECLDSQNTMDEAEDVDPFAETMEAYLPGFSAISLPEIGKWMLKTAKRLSQLQKSSIISDPHDKVDQLSQDGSIAKNNCNKALNHMHSTSTVACTQEQLILDSSELEIRAHGERRGVVIQTVDSDSVATLRELCPAASTAELQHCLNMSNGNIEEAACLLLLRQESGTVITVQTASLAHKASTTSGSGLQSDESLKDCILAKYSFVDISEDKIEHKPELFSKEQKKMIRYRDGQVVSTKGERFSEIKKQETEELKKTYINLKPFHSYKFH